GVPWRYVNVRRLVSYVEESILEGVRWAVFEPNTPALWKALQRTITEFLTRVWEAGALFGQTASQAFYVKIDEELNTDAVRELGGDRKSTRLNSSHDQISYAVFCLKKKNISYFTDLRRHTSQR